MINSRSRPLGDATLHPCQYSLVEDISFNSRSRSLGVLDISSELAGSQPEGEQLLTLWFKCRTA